MKGKKSGIGLTHAMNGLMKAFHYERNFRIHLGLSVLVILISVAFRLDKLEWLFIILVIHLVLLTELINSVVEHLIDYLKPDIHPQAKLIKDMSAATVLITVIVSIIVGLIIFIPKLSIF